MSAFFGSTTHGTVADSVIGVSVVLADGTLVTTGSGGRKNTKPFTREGGPDMTGLFLGDNGAMGFKVSATLRLKPRPVHVGYLSFGFASMAAMARAQVGMSALDAISEGFGIDRHRRSRGIGGWGWRPGLEPGLRAGWRPGFRRVLRAGFRPGARFFFTPVAGGGRATGDVAGGPCI